MKNFDIGDVVVIKNDIAGMKKGEIGLVSDKLEEHGLLEIMIGRKTYNMLPQWLEHYQI